MDSVVRRFFSLTFLAKPSSLSTSDLPDFDIKLKLNEILASSEESFEELIEKFTERFSFGEANDFIQRKG